MTKAEIIARFKETVKHIDTIKEDEFDYTDWVTKSERRCGTVCCIAGWYPKFFPNDFRWIKDDEKLFAMGMPSDPQCMEACLVKFHGIRIRAVDSLFKGFELVKGHVRIFNQIPTDSKIEVVKQRFIRFLELLEHGTELDAFLIID